MSEVFYAAECTVYRQKNNKAFMILSALGILFVIDSHVGPDFSQYLVFFPYDSFYMPMFAFISGYFFTEKHIQSWKHVFRFADSKIRTLLIPYFGWLVFYGIVTALLRYFDVLEIGDVLLIDLIHNIYIKSPAPFGAGLFYVFMQREEKYRFTFLRKNTIMKR